MIKLFKKSASSPAPPEWAENAVIYEVNTRQFTREGTFTALASHLDRLKKLGVDILWFMPIHPIGEKHRKGALGSYYAVKDYYAINPEFGTLKDFKTLVQQIHSLGMRVIIDLVINHSAWDNELVTRHPEWYKQDKNGNIIAPIPDWTDVAAFNYNNKDLWVYMTEMMRYWISDMGIDGFRCDVAEMVDGKFWAHSIPELNKTKPIFMLAEGEAPDLHINGFNMTYSTNMYRTFNAISKNKKTAEHIAKLLKNEKHEYPDGSMRMRFTCNHDENTWVAPAVERLGKVGVKAYTVLTYTLPGNPLIYNGQEIGSAQRLEFFVKDEIIWQDNEYTEFYTRLNKLRHEHPALFKGEMTLLSHHRILAFTRAFEQDIILTIVNLSANPATAAVPLKSHTGFWTDAFDGSTVHLTDEKWIVTLKPWEYKIFIKNIEK